MNRNSLWLALSGALTIFWTFNAVFAAVNASWIWLAVDLAFLFVSYASFSGALAARRQARSITRRHREAVIAWLNTYSDRRKVDLTKHDDE